MSRFVIGVREASRRGSGSWASTPSQMSDIKFLSSKLQTFALEDVVPDLVNDNDEGWNEEYAEQDADTFSVGSVNDQNVA